MNLILQLTSEKVHWGIYYETMLIIKGTHSNIEVTVGWSLGFNSFPCRTINPRSASIQDSHWHVCPQLGYAFNHRFLRPAKRRRHRSEGHFTTKTYLPIKSHRNKICLTFLKKRAYYIFTWLLIPLQNIVVPWSLNITLVDVLRDHTNILLHIWFIMT